jgi:DNA-binding transcriptional ArsR family regulator
MTTSILYHRIAEPVIDQLGPYDGWLYVVLTRLIPRKLNRARLSVSDLAEASKMSERSVIRYTAVLEQKGLIAVERSREQGQKIAKTNVYSLAGVYAQVTLGKASVDCLTDREGSDSKADGASDSAAQKESTKINDYQADDDLIFFFQFLKKEMGENIQPKLRDQLQRLGQAACIEVGQRCKNANSWEYIITALENQSPPAENPIPLPPSPGDPAKWESDKHEVEPDDEETQEELTPEFAIFNKVMDQLRLQWGKQGAYLRGIRMAQADGSRWLLQGDGISGRLLTDKRLQNNIAQLGRVLTGDQALIVEVV